MCGPENQRAIGYEKPSLQGAVESLRVLFGTRRKTQQTAPVDKRPDQIKGPTTVKT